jgi:hypothetical protein
MYELRDTWRLVYGVLVSLETKEEMARDGFGNFNGRSGSTK